MENELDFEEEIKMFIGPHCVEDMLTHICKSNETKIGKKTKN